VRSAGPDIERLRSTDDAWGPWKYRHPSHLIVSKLQFVVREELRRQIIIHLTPHGHCGQLGDFGIRLAERVSGGDGIGVFPEKLFGIKAVYRSAVIQQPASLSHSIVQFHV
jgi:hypothetical protein